MDKKKSIRREIKNIIKGLVEEYQPERIILFGSYIWGRPKKGSDIDLFIIKKGVGKQRHIERLWDIVGLVDCRKMGVDLLVYTPREVRERLKLEDPFIKKVIEKGEVIYG